MQYPALSGPEYDSDPANSLNSIHVSLLFKFWGEYKEDCIGLVPR